MDVLLDLGPGRTRAVAVEQALRRSILDGQLAAGNTTAVLTGARTRVGMRQGDGRRGLRAARGRGLPPRRGRIGHDRCRRSTDAAESRSPSRRSRSSPSSSPASPTRARSRARPGPRALRKVLHTHPDSLLGYGDRQGLAELRVALASYLARSRSVVADPSRIVIFGSFASALSVLASTLHRPRCQPHRRRGPGPAAAQEGDRGRRTHDRPGTRRRRRVVRRRTRPAERRRVHSRPPVPDRRRALGRPPLRPRRLGPTTVTAGSSKTITTASSATTVGRSERCKVSPPTASSMAAPQASRSHLASDSPGSCSRRHCSGRCSTPCDSGATPCRRSNKPRSPSSSCPAVWTDTCGRSAFAIDVDVTRSMRVLAHSAPWLRVTGVSAGLHVTAYLDDRDEREVIELAGRRSVALFGIADHSIAAPTRQGLVIGYSRSPAHAFPQALETLAGVLDAS